MLIIQFVIHISRPHCFSCFFPASTSDPVFTIGENNAVKLVHDGFDFIESHPIKKGTIWVCSFAIKSRCKARVVLNKDEQVISYNNRHNHRDKYIPRIVKSASAVPKRTINSTSYRNKIILFELPDGHALVQLERLCGLCVHCLRKNRENPKSPKLPRVRTFCQKCTTWTCWLCFGQKHEVSDNIFFQNVRPDPK